MLERWGITSGLPCSMVSHVNFVVNGDVFVQTCIRVWNDIITFPTSYLTWLLKDKTTAELITGLS